MSESTAPSQEGPPGASGSPGPEGLTPEVAALLARTRLRVDARRFIIAVVPARHEQEIRRRLTTVMAPFFVQSSGDERTVILAEDEWARIRGRFRGAKEEPGHRLITLQVELDRKVIGYLAVVTRALADAGAPIGVLSSFHFDHLLVREERLGDAMAALWRLLDAARAAST